MVQSESQKSPEMDASRHPGRRRAVTAVLSFYVLLGGLLSLIGWCADLPILTDWDNNGGSIQPNATVAVAACGAAMVLLLGGFPRAASVLGAVVAVIGGSSLFQYVGIVQFEFI